MTQTSGTALTPLSRRTLLAAACALPIAALCGCGRRRVRAQRVAPGTTVLALGDSLTHGTGADSESGYPAVLASLTGWQIVNAGVPGDTSAQALQRLPALLEQHRPALVLVGIGGNDLLRRLPEAELRANLQRIVELCLASGAQVLLIAVPRPTLAAAFTGSLSDHPVYAEVADALRVPLAARGWSRVLADESLRSDAIHANAQGYAQMARHLHAAAVDAGLADAR